MADVLDQLSVQGKCNNETCMARLELTWNRLVTGLTVGRLSFILTAYLDCLSTPLDLRYGTG